MGKDALKTCKAQAAPKSLLENEDLLTSLSLHQPRSGWAPLRVELHEGQGASTQCAAGQALWDSAGAVSLCWAGCFHASPRR